MAALRCPKQVFETLCPEQMNKMLKDGADPNAQDQFGYAPFYAMQIPCHALACHSSCFRELGRGA